jgi:protein O-mannosyl-transferase
MSSSKKENPKKARPTVRAAPTDLLDKVSSPPWSFALIAGLILFCYFQTLPFQWTRFDDDLIITNQIEAYKDFGQAATSFTRDAFNREKGDIFYRPMQNLSFFLDAQLSGAAPAGFKLTNLLLHFFTCLCLLSLFRLLKLDRRLSWIAVLLFSVHPLFNHAVIWIPSRGDLFIALFGTLSYIGFLQVLENNRIRSVALHALGFSLAVFSKETALFLPLIFIFHWALFCRPFKFSASHFRLVAVWLVVASVYVGARNLVIVTGAKSDEFGIGPLLGNLRVLPELASKFFVPFGLSVMPVFSIVPTMMGTIFLCLLVVFILVAREPERSLGSIGLAWFVLFTAVTMLYRHGLGKAAYDYLEHRAYMPSIGLLIILIAFGQDKLPRRVIRKTCLAGLLIAAVLCSISIVHSLDYRNPFTFYAAATRSNPGCALAYYNRAQYRTSLGDRAGAILDYDESIRVKPDLADAYYNRGNAKKDQGDWKGALADYGEAIRYKSGFELAYYNRGTIRLNMKDGRGAIDDLSAALTLNPKNARALNNRGAAYYAQGQIGLAMSDFNGAVGIDPAYGDAWRNRGYARWQGSDVFGACSDWQAGQRAGSAESAKLLQQHCR